MRFIKTFLLCVALLAATAAGSEAKKLRVAFVGDPQVDDLQELSYARKTIYKELRLRKDLDLVVILGDIVNDDVRLLAPSKASLDSLPCPWVAVPGNHDRDMYTAKKGRQVNDIVDPDRSRDMATYTRIIGKPDTSLVMGGVKFIMMDDVRLVGKAAYEGGFREDQKKWLTEQLNATPKDMLAVLSVHIPFHEFKSRDSLQTILSIHPKLLLMCGHTHSAARFPVDLPDGGKVEEVLAGATCGTFWRGKPGEDGVPHALMNCGAPRGYYVADFDAKGRYTLDYKRVGATASDKASVHVSEDGSRVIVNVYGGATNGTVKVKLPGVKGNRTTSRKEMVAPEVEAIQAEQKALPRKQRRLRNRDYIPLRSYKSPHIWTVRLEDGDKPAAGKATVLYDDGSMKFKVKRPVNLIGK